jgi:hypothetical protein
MPATGGGAGRDFRQRVRIAPRLEQADDDADRNHPIADPAAAARRSRGPPGPVLGDDDRDPAGNRSGGGGHEPPGRRVDLAGGRARLRDRHASWHLAGSQAPRTDRAQALDRARIRKRTGRHRRHAGADDPGHARMPVLRQQGDRGDDRAPALRTQATEPARPGQPLYPGLRTSQAIITPITR